jgi:uncharacterized OB-fold protein
VPRQSPVPDEVDLPFWTAANDDRLVFQYCRSCTRWQFPPNAACEECGSAGSIEWRDVDGRGEIYSFAVIYDTPIAVMQPDQPYHSVVVTLADCPGINVVSQLRSCPPGAVSIGDPVRVTFVGSAATEQKVPEWVLDLPAADGGQTGRA